MSDSPVKNKLVENKVVDAEERQRAIDYQQSYIVQAPAGSGKTELLTQRYLNILAHSVAVPEEVLAITFTRKAAAEMRERIVESLLNAKNNPCPDQEPKKTNWTLAKKVIDRDAELQWNLIHNPNRLRIQTIDGFCTSLVKQMPIVSEHGATPAIVDDAEPHYLAAATETLMQIGEGAPWSEAIELLLGYLDNDFNRLVRMLASMLAKRDQWLETITGSSLQLRSEADSLRDELELALQTAVSDHLKVTRQAFDDFLKQQNLGDSFFQLLDFAATQVDSGNPLVLWMQKEDRQSLPSAAADNLPLWQAIGSWLLKDDGNWRKQLTAKQGFPAPSKVKDKDTKALYKARKDAMAEFLGVCTESASAIQLVMADLKKLPCIRYGDGQWRVLAALLELLPVATAFLKVEFQHQGAVDFVEVAQGALRALGEGDEPSDVALKLDYQIRHMLIDEFQDTSVSQYRLVEKLLQGWEPGDGRTLFLVGDPMQSIYRFRQADVSLFLKSRLQGVGGLPLESLVLRTNFRSQLPIIEWINGAFQSIFPDTDQLEHGGVSYSTAVAGLPFEESEAVPTYNSRSAVHRDFYFDNEDTLAGMIDRIEEIKQVEGKASIAVLIRARSHAQALTRALLQKGFPVKAVEMESLYEQPVIQDLLSLTRALMDLSDQVAWYAVLRAPWCGATLQDLLTVSQVNRQGTVLQNLWSLLADQNVKGANPFSSDGLLERLAYLGQLLQQKIAHRSRSELRAWIESTWYCLGAPDYCDPQALSHANAYFDMLGQLSQEDSLSAKQVIEAVAKLKADSLTAQEGAIEVMTIHKSKGLEFDHVFIPALEKKGRPDSPPLLDWSRNTSTQNNDAYLVMAPVKAKELTSEPITAYLRHLDSRKSAYEIERLLYVGATRAKKSLHLFATLRGDVEKETLKNPEKGSFLAAIDKASQIPWQDLSTEFSQWAVAARQTDEEDANAAVVEKLSHESIWRLKASADASPITELEDELIQLEESLPRPESQERDAKMRTSSGIVLHRLIENLTHYLAKGRPVDQLQISKEHVLHALKREGAAMWAATDDASTATAELIEQCDMIVSALENMLADEKGRWILANHTEAASEYALKYVSSGRVETIVIDRTFIDAQGRRWIIDFKLPQQKALTDKQFQKLIKQYEGQLQLYAKVLAKTEQRPIRLGLYLPYQKLWHEWDSVADEIAQQELFF